MLFPYLFAGVELCTIAVTAIISGIILTPVSCPLPSSANAFAPIPPLKSLFLEKSFWAKSLILPVKSTIEISPSVVCSIKLPSSSLSLPIVYLNLRIFHEVKVCIIFCFYTL